MRLVNKSDFGPKKCHLDLREADWIRCAKLDLQWANSTLNADSAIGAFMGALLRQVP